MADPTPPSARSADDIKRDPLVARACERAGAAITGAKEFAGEITLAVDRDRIREVASTFKDDGFNYLVDLSAIDYSKYPNHAGPRFAVAYMLYSFQKNARVRLKVATDEETPIPSVSSVWRTANWHERETFDLFGVVFDGHPDLRRILLPDDWQGHALRKDFPLRGYEPYSLK